jgi:tetratricopeptide (TPR) repeat protein
LRGDDDGAAEVAVELARCFWLSGDRDMAYPYVDRALELAEDRAVSRARAHALVARAAYHMLASEHAQAIDIAREALPLTEALGIDNLRARALDVLGASRAYLGDVEGLDDSRRAIALARQCNAFHQLISAEVNLYENEFFLGDLAAASRALLTLRRDGRSYGDAMTRRWVRAVEAHEAVIQGRWGVATGILDQLIAEAEAGRAHYLDPACRALRASIAFAQGNLDGGATGSEKALVRARSTKDPQLLAPVLALRSIVLLALGRREEASILASDALALPLSALLEVIPAATPIEFSWLLRDLGRQAELLPALESAPSTLWFQGARAIAEGDFNLGVERVASLGAPSVEAYTRLRAAEELARSGDDAEASEVLAPALDFFRSVGAKRYLEQAEALLDRSP